MMNKNYKETLLIALPVIIGQVSQLLMNVSDSVIVGRLGERALSAAAFANSCFILIAIFAFGALNAVPSIVAEARGAENQEAIRQNLRAAIWSGLFWGILIGLLVYLFSLLMPYMQQPESDVLQAQPFMCLLALSTPFMCLYTAIKGYFDGMEKTSVGMNISLLGLGLNIFFNIAFVFGRFGFPNLGLIGSAWATLLSRVLIFIIVMVVVKKHPLTKDIFSLQMPDFQYIKNIIVLGFPMGLQLFFEVAAFSGAGIMIGWLPEEQAIAGRAAHQIVLNTVSVTFMVMLGVSVAGSVRVGEALGRKDNQGMYEAGKTALVLGLAIAAISSLFLVVFRNQFTALYGIESAEVGAIVVRLTIVAAIFQFFDGCQCVGAGLLRGLQDVTVPTIITFVAYWILWLPLAYWLGFKQNMGVDGIWYSDVFALGFAAILLNVRFFSMVKKVKLI
jgi:MATE family multidrug resistance protein